jgi:uncharacterized protein
MSGFQARSLPVRRESFMVAYYESSRDIMTTLLFTSALTLGLVTGIHCIGMCGPLALALPLTGRSRAAYVAGRVLYNLGRAVTYAAMGAAVGLVGQVGRSFDAGGFQRWVSIAAGVLLLAGLFIFKAGLLEKLGVFRLFAVLQRIWARNFRQRGFTGLFLLGLINGLLPCGPVYVALAAALATGQVVTAALFMFIFGLGTLPAMLAVSLAGKLVQLPLRRRLQRLVPVSTVVVALLLLLRGLALGIPFLSPPAQATELGGKPGACCGTRP